MPEPKDGFDRLLDAVERAESSARKSSSNLEAVKSTVEVLRDRMATSERRIEAVERNDEHHIVGIRQASESDAKLQSDQAATIIALQETKNSAAKAQRASEQALKELGELRSGQTALVKETKQQTVEIKKNPTMPTAAAILNLAVGVVYLVMEFLKHLHK